MNARYRLLDPEDVAALSPAEAKKYADERARFDAEVVQHRVHLEREGWLNVGTKGREVRFYLQAVRPPETPK